jgi:hypothetical protein
MVASADVSPPQAFGLAVVPPGDFKDAPLVFDLDQVEQHGHRFAEIDEFYGGLRLAGAALIDRDVEIGRLRPGTAIRSATATSNKVRGTPVRPGPVVLGAGWFVAGASIAVQDVVRDWFRTCSGLALADAKRHVNARLGV